MNHEKWNKRFEDLLRRAMARADGLLSTEIRKAREEYAAENKAWASSHAPKQSSLFGENTARGPGPHRSGGPRASIPYRPSVKSKTSLAAAASISPDEAISKREKVFKCIDDSGELGRTDEEISLATGIVKDTVRPRRGDLEKLGRVVDSGRTRPGISGRQFTVWVVLGKSLEGWTK